MVFLVVKVIQDGIGMMREMSDVQLQLCLVPMSFIHVLRTPSCSQIRNAQTAISSSDGRGVWSGVFIFRKLPVIYSHGENTVAGSLRIWGVTLPCGRKVRLRFLPDGAELENPFPKLSLTSGL